MHKLGSSLLYTLSLVVRFWGQAQTTASFVSIRLSIRHPPNRKESEPRRVVDVAGDGRSAWSHRSCCGCHGSACILLRTPPPDLSHILGRTLRFLFPTAPHRTREHRPPSSPTRISERTLHLLEQAFPLFPLCALPQSPLASLPHIPSHIRGRIPGASSVSSYVCPVSVSPGLRVEFSQRRLRGVAGRLRRRDLSGATDHCRAAHTGFVNAHALPPWSLLRAMRGQGVGWVRRTVG